MYGTGFGFYRDEEGKLIRKESNFGLIVGKDVEVGLNSVIDNGSYRNTEIGDGTKIDNLVHVAHNCIIGKHCLIVAGTILGGSSEIGDFTHIGLNASIKEHIKIGNHCIIGAGSVVVKDVPDNTIVAGCPAKPLEKCNLTPKELWNMAGIKKDV